MKTKTIFQITVLSIFIIGILLILYVLNYTSITRSGFVNSWLKNYAGTAVSPSIDPFFSRLSLAAIERTKHKVRYNPSYIPIPYPNGDVPSDIGVCADEIIRAYRMVGIDLQKEIHEDMAKHFVNYPKMWRLSEPDTNIDHRRVPNLMTFFTRHGVSLSISSDPSDYFPGDIVAWELSNRLLHIGIVVEPLSLSGKRHLIVHNIGSGPKMEDALFIGRVIGHFRYKKK